MRKLLTQKYEKIPSSPNNKKQKRNKNLEEKISPNAASNADSRGGDQRSGDQGGGVQGGGVQRGDSSSVDGGEGNSDRLTTSELRNNVKNSGNAQKEVKKKIPYLEDWRTQYHSPKVMPKHA